MTPVVWERGPFFAEVAEVLRINTNQVFGIGDKEPLVVIFTPDGAGEPPFWRALMARDADGVLCLMGEPEEIDFYPKKEMGQ